MCPLFSLSPLFPSCPWIPARHCNLAFHPDLGKQPPGIERPGSYSSKPCIHEPDVVIGLPVKQATFKIQGLGPVARGKIGARKPACTINRVSHANLSRPVMIRDIQLQHNTRKEVFGVFPVNTERGQNGLCDRPCIACGGVIAGIGTRDLAPDTVMNKSAIQCQLAICCLEGKVAARCGPVRFKMEGTGRADY